MYGALFQVILRESLISIGDGIVRVGGTQLFHAERLPTLLVQAAPIDAHLANYFNQALPGRRKIQFSCSEPLSEVWASLFPKTRKQ
jgi:hypothetical protein